jgi:hypothetical protein
MMRHAPLPAPGKGIPARRSSAVHRGGSSRHNTNNAPTANTSRTRPTFTTADKDPDTVTTTGRRQSAGHNGV